MIPVNPNLSDTGESVSVGVAYVMVRLGVGRDAIYRAVRENKLPVIRLGRSIRFPRRAIEDIALNGNCPVR